MSPPGCASCGGAGWVQVTASYADRLVPDPDPDKLAGLALEHVAAVWDHVHARRAAAAQALYPCRHCNPDAFYRWAGGHWNRDHDRGACPDCATGRRRRRPAPEPDHGADPAPVLHLLPQRKDTD